MIDTFGPTFLRRPHGAVWAADVLRIVTLVSVPVAAVGWGAVAFAVTTLALLGTVVPRMLGLRPTFDAAVVLLCLVAAWSSVLDWYTTVFLWDKLVHVILVGLLAALLVVIASDAGVVVSAPRAGVLLSALVALAAGMAIGSVWEIGEWLGHNLVDDTIFVGYDDTIGDMAADGLGALLAGFALPWLSRERRVVQPMHLRG
ncbi:hypothetical protein DEJ33_12920 [Curtobacterium sp. MCPF17_047]|uniref:hypothetical protein n=1 Tax=Curtobacterium sp. MCPF17_047 TaxID=2175654 RepID=UPI000DAA1A55|nr:hypothetical protein [Curtobacterium sp. MCPF17_047]PZF64012.1 hypothetical protein DEJ33_12920 [Curtobacterium sp. MCPF17_047]